MSVYIFHHIPKCAGTSCRTAFQSWFDVVSDYRKDWSEDATRKYIGRKYALDQLTEAQMLAGHFELEGAYLHQRYPEVFRDPQYRIITFVRDPIEIPQSMHHYAKQRRPDYRVNSLPDRVAQKDNILSRLLQCDADNFKAVIDRYHFVGTVERLQESMDYLAQDIGKPPLTVGTLNQTPRNESLSPREIEEFRARNSLDYRVYEYCREKLMQDLSRL